MLYKNDLDDNFSTEVLHYKEYDISIFEQFIDEKLEQTFPNVFIALRILFPWQYPTALVKGHFPH
jgi:hypothetical protein